MPRGTSTRSIAFPCRRSVSRSERRASGEEDRDMTLFESVARNEKFVLPKATWIIPGLTLGVSLVAVALALS